MEQRLPDSPDILHAEITRGDAAALELHEGDTIYVRALRIPAVELATAGAVLARPVVIAAT